MPKRFTRTGYLCQRCGHVTYPRDGGEPTACGGCKSPYWRTKRKTRKAVQP